MPSTDGTILLGEKRSIDKTGLEKISRRLFFTSYQSAVTGAYEEVGAEYDDALFVGAQAQGDEAGNWIAQFDYEKVSGEDNDKEDIGLVEELDFSMSQNPVQSSPKFSDMVKTYGWDASLKSFPQNLSDGTPSPVYGTSDFLSYTCVYRQTKTVKSVNSIIFENIGTIIEDPPFQKLEDPSMGDDRTWLYLAPKISTRGNAFQIVQEWMLSGAGGWLEAIYSDTALKVLDTANN